MVAKRIAAVLAALALIVGAVVLRRQLNEDDAQSSDGGGTGPTVTDVSNADGATVACITDLATQCRAIQAADDSITIVIEDWSTTADAIASGNGPDGWITLAPLASLAQFDETVQAASTRMTAVVREERFEALTAGCADQTLWRCVGEHAGDPWTELNGPASWGKVLPGIPDPTKSAIGALLLANAHVGFFAGTDLGPTGAENFQSVDTEADSEHAGWNTRIARSIPKDALSNPLALLIQRQSAVNVVATTTAELGSIPASSAASLRSIDPQPAGRVDAVVTGIGSRFEVDRLALSLQSELKASGWTSPESGTDGVPSGATVVHVRNLWQGAR